MTIITELQLEHNQITRKLLGFPADKGAWFATWVNAKTFLISFRSEYQKTKNGGVVENAYAFSFLFTTTDFNFFPYIKRPI